MSFPVDDVRSFVEEQLDYDDLGARVENVENSGDILDIEIKVVHPRKEDVIGDAEDLFRAVEAAETVSQEFGYDVDVVRGANYMSYRMTIYG